MVPAAGTTWAAHETETKLRAIPIRSFASISDLLVERGGRNDGLPKLNGMESSLHMQAGTKARHDRGGKAMGTDPNIYLDAETALARVTSL